MYDFHFFYQLIIFPSQSNCFELSKVTALYQHNYITHFSKQLRVLVNNKHCNVTRWLFSIFNINETFEHRIRLIHEFSRVRQPLNCDVIVGKQ